MEKDNSFGVNSPGSIGAVSLRPVGGSNIKPSPNTCLFKTSWRRRRKLTNSKAAFSVLNETRLLTDSRKVWRIFSTHFKLMSWDIYWARKFWPFIYLLKEHSKLIPARRFGFAFICIHFEEAVSLLAHTNRFTARRWCQVEVWKTR